MTKTEDFVSSFAGEAIETKWLARNFPKPGGPYVILPRKWQPMCVTYGSPNGDTICLSHEQIQALEVKGLWPRDAAGQEYRSVVRGLHRNTPTYEGLQFGALVRELKASI